MSLTLSEKDFVTTLFAQRETTLKLQYSGKSAQKTSRLAMKQKQRHFRQLQDGSRAVFLSVTSRCPTGSYVLCWCT